MTEEAYSIQSASAEIKSAEDIKDAFADWQYRQL